MKQKYPFNSKTILCISDMHVPYQHPDALRFLQALKRQYRPDLVVNLGDAVDFHSISFHPKDPDLLSPGDELSAIRKEMRALEKMFPKMVVIGSNHGDLPLRKIKDAGLPTKFLRPYNDIYGVGPGWVFCDDLTLEDDSDIVYFAHGISKNGLKLATQRGVHVVQGHYHTEFRVDYVSNPRNLLWSVNGGCLIDREALAFAYGKLTLDRPIIGTPVIVNGQPRLEPMILGRDGRWIGELV